jgi:hypothetical protein
VLVLGWQKRSGSSDRLLSMAWLSPRQRFVSGEVLRRVMRLEGLSSTRALTRVGKCHQVTWGKDTTFRLLPPDDLDCDGKGTTADPPDCNDNDAEIGPGFFEYCDGKENNCDGKPAASTIECYANDTANGGGCFSGTRGCVDEGQNAGPTGACQLTTSVAPAGLLCCLQKLQPHRRAALRSFGFEKDLQVHVGPRRWRLRRHPRNTSANEQRQLQMEGGRKRGSRAHDQRQGWKLANRAR